MKPYQGTYYTVLFFASNFVKFKVNPVAIQSSIPVYCENKRTVVVLQTETFGKVCFVAVGATLVGSIIFTKHIGDEITK